ncbi:MAG TPA: SpoIIE family protein phosphatase [Streptosporangiaceae bacterium]
MPVRGSKLVPHILTTEQILNRVETAVIVVDHDGCLRYANAFAAALFGYKGPADLTDVPFRHLGFLEEDVRKVDSLEDQACRGRDWEGTLAIRRPDQSTFFVRMVAAPLRGPAGEVSGTVIMARQAVQVGMQGSLSRTGLLDRIGERLASSLELDETLQRVADTLVPQFADHCFIELSGKDGTLVRRVQINAWGWEPSQGGWTKPGDIVAYPPEHFCSRAMATGETVLVEDLADEPDWSPTESGRAASREIGMTSVIAAPLTLRGKPLGVIVLALSDLTERDTRHYSADDRDLVSAIASRVAVAIDNAQLFEEERATALAFQNSLLPSRPPELDGLEVAYRYVPAKPLETHGQGIQTQVGGDWYDIIQLSAGRVGIVIGDVEGRGARAAAIMGQLRSALRAFAQDDKAPADILRRLDEWCRTMTEDPDDSGLDAPIVSCTYMIYDPWFRKLTIANAGHMSPLLVTGEDVSPLEIEHQGVLLGVRGMLGLPGLPMYREETRALPAGSTLIFYTDGLVDRRHRADGPGHYEDAEVFGMLSKAVMSVASHSVERVAQAAEHAVPGQIDDDMAILVIRTSEQELPTWDVKYPAEPIKVSEARRMAFDTFVQCGMDGEQADLACLLVSEVVTNVVLHTAAAPAPRHELALEAVGMAAVNGAFEDWLDSPFGDDLGGHGPLTGLHGQEFMVRIRQGRSSVWVEVFDSDLRLPRIRAAGENDEGGRGLYLVEQLANRWGSRPTDDGKAVWFEMPIKAQPASRLSAGRLWPGERFSGLAGFGG